MTALRTLVLVANDSEVIERLDNEYSTAGLAAALVSAAHREVLVTFATREPQKHAAKPYARDAIIHSLASPTRPLTDRVLASLGAAKLRAALTATPIGRLINSLSPTDPSRVFARAYRHTPVTTPPEFDLVIALDVAAIRTAWFFAKRNRATTAVFGDAAALAYLSEQSS